MGIELVGASVRGPRHIRDGASNQDAWGHAHARGHRVVVVADGLGSRPESASGARAACRAVPQALRAWLECPGAHLDLLPALIHVLWRVALAELPPEDACTTCLFAAVAEDGSGWIGQLGDGLVLVENSASQLEVLAERDDNSFGNETRALGATRKISAWNLRRVAPGTQRILLCTDGVADDLLPARFPALLQWITSDLMSQPPTTRWRQLATELRNWPTPNHTDDKTLAYIRITP